MVLSLVLSQVWSFVTELNELDTKIQKNSNDLVFIGDASILMSQKIGQCQLDKRIYQSLRKV